MSGLIVALIVVIALIALAIWISKRIWWFAINSILGLFALLGWNLMFSPVAVNVWSVGLVAIFGVIGFLAVIILHWIGIAF